MGKTCKYCWICYLIANWSKITLVLNFSAFSAKVTHKTHKITSLEDDMRKILTQKFWSHGTPLGYLGPVSQKALTQWACRLHIHLIWGPYEFPALVALQIHAKKPKPIPAWCEKYFNLDVFPQISYEVIHCCQFDLHPLLSSISRGREQPLFVCASAANFHYLCARAGTDYSSSKSKSVT